jgi:hypothetical protein
MKHRQMFTRRVMVLSRVSLSDGLREFNRLFSCSHSNREKLIISTVSLLNIILSFKNNKTVFFDYFSTFRPHGILPRMI